MNTERNTYPARSKSLPLKQEHCNPFITAEILDYPVVDLGAFISVIHAEFVKEAFFQETTPIMAPSTYPRVDTVSCEKLPPIGKIDTTLSFGGRKIPCQFHVVQNMTTNAALGGDFLSTNGAIINFADETLNLSNSHPVELPLTAIRSPPMANFLKVPDQYDQVAPSLNNGEPAPICPKYFCFSDRFTQQCEQSTFSFLKFLIILLLM